MGYQGQATCESGLSPRQARGSTKNQPFDKGKQFDGAEAGASKQSHPGCFGAKEAD